MGLGRAKGLFSRPISNVIFVHKAFSDYPADGLSLLGTPRGLSASFCLRYYSSLFFISFAEIHTPWGWGWPHIICVSPAVLSAEDTLQKLELSCVDWDWKDGRESRSTLNTSCIFKSWRSLPTPPRGKVLAMSWCVEDAFLVEGLAVKPCQGIFKWMSPQNP